VVQGGALEGRAPRFRFFKDTSVKYKGLRKVKKSKALPIAVRGGP
jgi:hypothetical protein